MVFSLHGNLAPESLTEGVTLVAAKAEQDTADKGMDQEDYRSVIESKHYRVEVNGEAPDKLSLAFTGMINHPVRQLTRSEMTSMPIFSRCWRPIFIPGIPR